MAVVTHFYLYDALAVLSISTRIKDAQSVLSLRLVQAKWKVSGLFIDQTTYFRKDIFGHLIWSTWKTKPYSEKAETSFDVYILGESYGVHELMVSHKPSGEASQHNYTTILHWGELAETIRQLNLVGKTFNLYSPPEGQTTGPFIIEIV